MSRGAEESDGESGILEEDKGMSMGSETPLPLLVETPCAVDGILPPKVEDEDDESSLMLDSFSMVGSSKKSNWNTESLLSIATGWMEGCMSRDNDEM